MLHNFYITTQIKLYQHLKYNKYIKAWKQQKQIMVILV